MKTSNELSYLNEKLETLTYYNYVTALIQWDLETGAPKYAIKKAAKSLGFFSKEEYKLLTDKKFIETVAILYKNLAKLDEINKKIVIEIRKKIDIIKKIPLNEYVEYSELVSQSQNIWEEAHKNSDFLLFLPYLEKIISYKKKYVEYKGYNDHPYNALLDDYEPGMSVEVLDSFFTDLKKHLIPLIQKVSKKNSISNRTLNLTFSIEKQKEFSRELATYLGFDFDRGVLKESTHPFTLNLNKYDVRMTTRYAKNNLNSSLFGTIHETGHAIYEQNIGENIWNSILGTGNSMGIHESQSRLYENLIGKNYEFWAPLYPKLKKMFPTSLKDITIDDFYSSINMSHPSPIRVEADELTYSLHIILRYEIEKELIEGSIKVVDLPKIWSDRMEKYLGITPKTDKDGVLQDVHWAAGLIGYFPSYALGSAYASQIMNTMSKKIDVDSQLKKGNLDIIKKYLAENIHKYGKLKDPNELMIGATGESPNSKYYIEYLTNKYSKIYNL